MHPTFCPCGKPLSRPPHRRKTNLCRRCATKQLCKSVAHRQRLSEGQKRRFADELERIQHGRQIRKGWRTALEDPHKRAAAALRGQAVGRTNRGRKLDPELVARRAAAIAAAKLADIPENRRDEYRAVMRAKKCSAAEARASIGLGQPERRTVKLDLRNAPSGMELLAESWRKKQKEQASGQ